MFVDQRVCPAFRVDYLGPFPVPKPIIGARLQGLRGAELRAVEDRDLRALIKLQESAGLTVVSDGEIRRSFGHCDFLKGIVGIEVSHDDPGGLGIALGALSPIRLQRHHALSFPASHPYVADCRILSAMTRAAPKVCLPSPASVLLALAAGASDDTFDHLASELVTVWRQALHALRAEGCHYVLLDEVRFHDLSLAPTELLRRAIATLSLVFRDRPPDMSIGLRVGAQAAPAPDVPTTALRMIAESVPLDAVFLPRQATDWSLSSYWARTRTRVYPILFALDQVDGMTSDTLCREIDRVTKYLPLGQIGLAAAAGTGAWSGNDDQLTRTFRLLAKAARGIWNEV